MASQIPGYEYDVFISYRHNDNKTLSAKAGVTGHNGSAEGWVSEFVANLRLELEATVKGKVNIYFDRNQNDGLLETHNVDESLSSKIKSLIFIPIISQTYCDPESYAWRHEFISFNKMTAQDKFGPTIRLLSGNATNRVLPIQIHDLDASDLTILEGALKSKLRPIDFIFKAPGINRPLRVHEDDPLKNIYKTVYRDQVNKTANAIKDIISALKNFDVRPGKIEEKKNIPSILTGTDRKINTIKSVAVLPFVCEGNDVEKVYLGEEIADEILNSLSRLRDLKVASRSQSFRHAPQNNVKTLSKSLLVRILVQGSVQATPEWLWVTIKMTRSGEELPFWSQEYKIPASELFLLASKITDDIVRALEVTLQQGERNAMGRHSTANNTAYESFLKGRFYLHKTGDDLLKSITFFEQAITSDPKFARAHAGAAELNVLLCCNGQIPFQEGVEKSKDAALKALDIDPGLTEAYSVLAFVSMCSEWNWPEVEPLYNKAFAINPANLKVGEKYRFILQQIKSSFDESEQDHLITMPYFLKAYALLHLGKFEDALESAEEAVKRDPNSFMAQRALGLSHMGLEKYEDAIISLEEAATLSNRHQWLLFELMGAYTQAGRRDDALAIMDEAMARANIVPAKVYNFFFPH